VADLATRASNVVCVYDLPKEEEKKLAEWLKVPIHRQTVQHAINDEIIKFGQMLEKTGDKKTELVLDTKTPHLSKEESYQGPVSLPVAGAPVAGAPVTGEAITATPVTATSESNDTKDRKSAPVVEQVPGANKRYYSRPFLCCSFATFKARCMDMWYVFSPYFCVFPCFLHYLVTNSGCIDCE